ncbi:MAG: HD-GYP domain-containing protein [Candidatus Latescibacterota bacterium]
MPMSDTIGMEKFYFSVHPQIFRVETIRTFDLFVANSDGRIGLFHSAGEIYTAEYHRKVYKEGISALYIRTSDKGRFTTYLEENFPFIMDDHLIGSEGKAEIAHEVLTFIAITLFSNPGAEIVASFKKAIEKVTEYVLANEESVKQLIRLTTNGFQEYNHAVNVGIFGLGLAREVFGVKSGNNMPEIAAGFFLHDIGKYTIPRHICRRNGPLSAEEWKIMRTHPEQGYKMLQVFNAISEEVGIIVLQHHERHNGTGYPRRLRGGKIHTYAKICAIADVFDALTAQRPYRTSKSSFHALAVMQNEMKNEFDPEFFARFVRLFSKV